MAGFSTIPRPSRSTPHARRHHSVVDPRLIALQERIYELQRILNTLRIQEWQGPAGDQYRRQVDQMHRWLTQAQYLLHQVGPALLAWDGLGSAPGTGAPAGSAAA